MIVVPIGDFVNIPPMQTTILSHTHPLNSDTNNYPNMHPRECSPTANGNTNLQRLLSAESNIITSSLFYYVNILDVSGLSRRLPFIMLISTVTVSKACNTRSVVLPQTSQD